MKINQITISHDKTSFGSFWGKLTGGAKKAPTLVNAAKPPDLVSQLRPQVRSNTPGIKLSPESLRLLKKPAGPPSSASTEVKPLLQEATPYDDGKQRLIRTLKKAQANTSSPTERAAVQTAIERIENPTKELYL